VRKTLVIGAIVGVLCLGAGVGIGAAVWSGDTSAAAARGFGNTGPATGKETRVSGYHRGIVVLSRHKGVVFTPDFGPSNCAVPGPLTSTGSTVGGLKGDYYTYNGTLYINNDGSCYFEVSKAYWSSSLGGRFALRSLGGDLDCIEHCFEPEETRYRGWWVYG
jgi:hypothetical protein